MMITKQLHISEKGNRARSSDDDQRIPSPSATASNQRMLMVLGLSVATLMFAMSASDIIPSTPTISWKTMDVAMPMSLSLPPPSFVVEGDPALPAFDQCCHEAGPEYCTASDQAWFPRMRAKHKLVADGNATLYWAHMRKAGGTTFQSYIESVNERLLKYLRGDNNMVNLSTPLPPTSLFTNGFQRTIRPHLQANSRHCVNEHPNSNQTLFVTILRDPFDRYVSEFNYLNLGEGLNAPDMPGKVKEWMNRSKAYRNFVPMKNARSDLIDNWQVRWYTNDCPCDDLAQPPASPDLAFWNQSNYRYWNAGCLKDFRINLTQQDVEVAKHQIEQHDVIGVAPYFEPGCNMLPWLLLAGSNAPAVNLTNERKNAAGDRKNKLRYYLHKQVARENLDPKLFELDNQLFAFADELAKRRMNLACCVYDKITSLE